MALGLLSLISTRAPALDTATGASSIGEWEATWTKVLTRHVDDSGRIDFDSLRRNHTDLDLIVAFAAAVDPITQPRQFPDEYSRLAFYINAYNALAMYRGRSGRGSRKSRRLEEVHFFLPQDVRCRRKINLPLQIRK